jgi:O-antigen/teichoic acid export membrane protein
MASGSARAARSAVWRVLGNSAWLIVAEGGARALSLGTILYLSRTLAPDGMGAVQFGLAVFTFLQLVSTGGVEVLLTPEAARRPQDLARLAGRSLLVGWSTFAVAFTLVATGTWALGMAPALWGGALAFGLVAVLAPVTLRFAFIGRERGRTVGTGIVAQHLVFFGLCVASVGRPDDVGRVALCWAAAFGARAASQLAIFAREHGAPRFDASGLAGVLSRTTRLGAGTVARGLVLGVDVLVLGLFRPADEVARYALAVKLPLFVASLATLFYTAVFPTLARAIAGGELERSRRIEVETLEAVLGAALPAALCLCLVADPLVVLLFGERFRDAAPLLAVLVWRIPLMAATGCFRTSLWARRPEADARIGVQVLVTAVVLLFAVAGRVGAPGVAVAMLVADAAALAMQLHAGGRHVLARVPPAALGRLATAMALAAVLVWTLPRDDGALSVAMALVAWVTAALVADAPYARRLGRELERPATP